MVKQLDNRISLEIESRYALWKFITFGLIINVIPRKKCIQKWFCFQMSLSFNVPAEAVSSLIGWKGNKIKDTQLKTSTRIKFLKQSEELFLVNIHGNLDDCYLAKSIILLGVRHHQAAIVPLKGVEHDQDESEVINHGLWAFIAEIRDLSLNH